jgi:small subunit ribosomal protein S3
MGQKVHPTGFRLGIATDWTSKWYADSANFADFLDEDMKIREFLKKKLAEDIERLRIEVAALVSVHINNVKINIEEIRKPELDAQLVAEGIASQLERRVMFRRAMRRSVTNAMRIGAEGIKINVSGRLNGAEIARNEWYREGRVPLHTLRADVDYGFAEALTTYGILGVKVWIYKGEVFDLETKDSGAKPASK